MLQSSTPALYRLKGGSGLYKSLYDVVASIDPRVLLFTLIQPKILA